MVAKPRKGLVFSSCVFLIIAVVLSLVSLGTEQWVVAKGELTLRGYENEQLSTIKYGLFSGTIFLFHTRTYYEITMTCILGDNVCAYLCKGTAEARELELRHLYNGQHVDFDMSCPQIIRRNPVRTPLNQSNRLHIRNGTKRVFINAALYISTVVFLSLAIIFGVWSVILSFWNTIANPNHVCLNIYGLFVYVTISSVALLTAIVLWGILYGTIIFNNVVILFTIQKEMDTQGLAELGYSYWLLLPSLLFYLTSFFFLYIRQYLISMELEKNVGAVSENNMMLHVK